jgi:hypothetical protein
MKNYTLDEKKEFFLSVEDRADEALAAGGVWFSSRLAKFSCLQSYLAQGGELVENEYLTWLEEFAQKFVQHILGGDDE